MEAVRDKCESKFTLETIDAALVGSCKAAREHQILSFIMGVMKEHDGRDWRRVKREVRKAIERKVFNGRTG